MGGGRPLSNVCVCVVSTEKLSSTALFGRREVFFNPGI